MTNPEICPHVCRAIQAYRDELDEKYGITFKRHLRDLQRIRDLALENGAYSAAVQAEYRRGQANGNIYINKSEIRHGTIDSMSKEEVLKALDEIKNSYDPVTYGNSDTGGHQRSKTRKRILETDQNESTKKVDSDSH